MPEKTESPNGEKETPGIKNRKSNFPDWYNELVLKAGLADFAPIAGCMTIRPYGYSIWEKIQGYFNLKIRETGHQNAYFPLFIPESLLKKEAEHFTGFVPEVAIIDKKEETGERYALRPTSETIIYDSFSKWVRSWRDLPIKINQWCNIIRWETKATRLFLRTREFLWQEGHTVHATHREAEKEALWALSTYRELMESQLAVPVLAGEKTEKERFAGALRTFTLEALMPDGKALQMGTSHDLGQNFSRPFGIRFRDRDEKEKYAWQTSWGFSTRLIGSLVMVHGDDKGLVLPPKIAPVQAVIIPIIFRGKKEKTLKKAAQIKGLLERDFRAELDDREEYSAGWKFNEWEMKGVPLRIEIGPKDLRKNQAVLARRDTGKKTTARISKLNSTVKKTLEGIQNNLLQKAGGFLKENIIDVAGFKELEAAIRNKKMARIGWCGGAVCEDELQERTAATIRLIPLKKEKGPSRCPVCGKAARKVAYVSRQY